MIKKLLWSLLPFIIGVLAGAGLTKNKAVFVLIIMYVVGVGLFSLLSKSIIKIKESTDKKAAIKESVMDGVQNFGEATYKGNQIGSDWFDKIYPNYALGFSMALFITCILCIIYKLWVWSLVTFLGLNLFIILNQIWRKVKYLGVEK